MNLYPLALILFLSTIPARAEDSSLQAAGELLHLQVEALKVSPPPNTPRNLFCDDQSGGPKHYQEVLKAQQQVFAADAQQFPEAQALVDGLVKHQSEVMDAAVRLWFRSCPSAATVAEAADDKKKDQCEAQKAQLLNLQDGVNQKNSLLEANAKNWKKAVAQVRAAKEQDKATIAKAQRTTPAAATKLTADLDSVYGDDPTLFGRIRNQLGNRNLGGAFTNLSPQFALVQYDWQLERNALKVKLQKTKANVAGCGTK